MSRPLIRNRLYARLLVSYVAAFAVPLLVFTVSGLLLTSRTARREEASRSRSVLATARLAFEDELRRLSAIAVTMRGEIGIADPTAADEPLDILRIQRRVSTYVEMNHLVSDVIYTDTDSRRYYGAGSVYSPGALVSRYFSGSSVDSYRLYQALATAQDPGFIFLDQATSPADLFYYYVIPLNPRTDRKRTILFVIPRTTFEARLLPGLTARDGSFFLVDGRGEVVIHVSDLGPRARAEVPGLVARGFTEGTVSLPGYRGYASVLRTEDLGWSLVRLAAPSAFRRTLAGYFLPVLLSAIILFLLEAIFLRLLLKWNYRPIADLMRDILRPSSAPAEIESAREAVHALREDHDRARAVGRLFHQLVAGPAETAADPLVETLAELGMGEEGTRYLPVLAGIAVPGAAIDPGAWNHHSLSFAPRIAGEMVLRLERPGATFLLSGGNGTTLQDMLPVLSTLKERLQAQSGSPCILTAGWLCGSARELRQSYREALRCEECGFDPDGDGLVFAEKPRAGAAAEYPLDELARLSACLEHGDRKSAHALFADLARKAREGAFPPERARQIVSVADFHVRKFLGPAGASAPVPADGGAATLAARFQLVLEALGPGNREAAECTDRTPSSRQEKLATYVNAHWSDRDFCLKSVADTVGLSVSAASACFTAVFGVTLVEFLAVRRIELAKTLLADGMPVKDVVTRVGYSDATSFIRKFRRLTGKTPGEWSRK